MHSANLVRVASVLLLAASFPAGGAEPAASSTAPTEAKEAPWRGSFVSYGHATSAISVDKAAEPYWNPFYVQTFVVQPEWHFTKHFFTRARFELEQELTLSDDTTYARQVMWSDLSLDLGTDGVKIPKAGIQVSGTVRLTAPLSKASAAQTKLTSIGPGVTLSRRFEVRSGLTVGYAARYTQRFHRFTTPGYDAPTITACGDLRDQVCTSLKGAEQRNVRADLLQGPTVSFDPLARLHLSATFQLSHAWLYALPSAPVAGQPLDAAGDVGVRQSTGFIVSTGFDVTRELTLTLAATTFTSQPGPDGRARTPFFNRNTLLSLDAALDVEALLKRIQ